MEKVNFYGIMDSYSKDNGNQELKMDMEFGNHQKEIFTKEIGS